jgi:hypothetical protein
MKLDEFVKQTLLDITNGVAEAQLATKLYIAPGFVENQKLTSPQMVRFDVAVTVSKEAGGGVSVWSLGDLKAGVNSEQTNKISFEVPVFFQAPTERSELRYSKKLKKS